MNFFENIVLGLPIWGWTIFTVAFSLALYFAKLEGKKISPKISKINEDLITKSSFVEAHDLNLLPIVRLIQTNVIKTRHVYLKDKNPQQVYLLEAIEEVSTIRNDSYENRLYSFSAILFKINLDINSKTKIVWSSLRLKFKIMPIAIGVSIVCTLLCCYFIQEIPNSSESNTDFYNESIFLVLKTTIFTPVLILMVFLSYFKIYRPIRKKQSLDQLNAIGVLEKYQLIKSKTKNINLVKELGFLVKNDELFLFYEVDYSILGSYTAEKAEIESNQLIELINSIS